MADLNSLVRQCASSPPNILRTLQKVQEACGYVPREAVPQIAQELGVTDSDVVGVLSFYHDLHTEPHGRHIVRFCMGDSCRAMHCEKSLTALEKRAGCKLGETSKDKRFTIEKVYCLGNCALSPSLMINDEVHGRFTPRTVTEILANCK